MIRKRAPAPLIAVAMLLAYWVATAESGSITQARCQADREELLLAIETNRKNSLTEINAQIEGALSEFQVSQLKALRETVWNDEEKQRGQAQSIYHDCMTAVRNAN